MGSSSTVTNPEVDLRFRFEISTASLISVESYLCIVKSSSDTENSMDAEISTNSQGLMTIEAIQKTLNRSRASVYRYANTDPAILNPPYDHRRLNPEHRADKDDLLLFHPNEVARFAKDVLGIRPVTIAIQPPAQNATQEILQAILTELQSIHRLLDSQH